MIIQFEKVCRFSIFDSRAHLTCDGSNERRVGRSRAVASAPVRKTGGRRPARALARSGPMAAALRDSAPTGGRPECDGRGGPDARSRAPVAHVPRGAQCHSKPACSRPEPARSHLGARGNGYRMPPRFAPCHMGGHEAGCQPWTTARLCRRVVYVALFWPLPANGRPRDIDVFSYHPIRNTEHFAMSRALRSNGSRSVEIGPLSKFTKDRPIKKITICEEHGSRYTNAGLQNVYAFFDGKDCFDVIRNQSRRVAVLTYAERPLPVQVVVCNHNFYCELQHWWTQVIGEFDMEHVKVAFDGKRVLTEPRLAGRHWASDDRLYCRHCRAPRIVLDGGRRCAPTRAELERLRAALDAPTEHRTIRNAAVILLQRINKYIRRGFTTCAPSPDGDADQCVPCDAVQQGHPGTYDIIEWDFVKR